MKLCCKSLFVVGMMTLCLGTQFSSVLVNAQDSTTEKKTEKKVEKKVEKKGGEGRVPAYYGQIGISQKQRDAIYAAQANYAAQIDVLQKQIKDLEGKRDAEVGAVLTADQQKQLAELVEAGKKKAGEQAKNKKKPDETEAAKPDAAKPEVKKTDAAKPEPKK